MGIDAYGGTVNEHEYLRTAPTTLDPVATATPSDIRITKVLNGYFVKVGCQTVVFESRSRMLSEIDRYYANPEAVEKEYRSKQ